MAGPGVPDVRNRGSHAAPTGRQDGGDPSNRGRAVTRSQRGMLLPGPSRRLTVRGGGPRRRRWMDDVPELPETAPVFRQIGLHAGAARCPPRPSRNSSTLGVNSPWQKLCCIRPGPYSAQERVVQRSKSPKSGRSEPFPRTAGQCWRVAEFCHGLSRGRRPLGHCVRTAPALPVAQLHNYYIRRARGLLGLGSARTWCPDHSSKELLWPPRTSTSPVETGSVG